jgi:hypothetical protein
MTDNGELWPRPDIAEETTPSGGGCASVGLHGPMVDALRLRWFQALVDWRVRRL